MRVQMLKVTGSLRDGISIVADWPTQSNNPQSMVLTEEQSRHLLFELKLIEKRELASSKIKENVHD